MRTVLVFAVGACLSLSACSRYGFDGDSAGDDAGVDVTRGDLTVEPGEAAPRPRDSAPGPDADVDGGGVAGLVVGQPQALWTTPNSARVRWSCAGTVPATASFELCYGQTLAELAAGGVCITPDDDAVLSTKQCGADVEMGTTVFGLDSDTQYQFEVRVVDQSGILRRYAGSTLRTTPSGTKGFVLFDDALAGGQLNAGTHTIGIDAFKGAAALQHDTTLGVTSSLGISGFGVTSVNVAVFGGAYIELFIDVSAAQHLTLTLRGAAGTFHVVRLPLDGKRGYQRVQAPLAKFRDETSNVALDPAGFATVNELRVGATWASTGFVRVDEIRFLWR